MLRSRRSYLLAVIWPRAGTSADKWEGCELNVCNGLQIVADVKLRKSERNPPPEEGLSQETMNKKLQVAARLAREMEAALEHFSEQVGFAARCDDSG